ncbi:hypothetical protein LCGC14_3134950, partial [marine sediment metagenome]
MSEFRNKTVKAEHLVDKFNRKIGSVRISITDRCNLRCKYCMPEEGIEWQKKEHILTFEEIIYLIRIFHSYGIKNYRLTGGEPTLFENDFLEILQICKKKFSQANIILLTNGKKFSSFDFTKKMTQIGLEKLLICISLHADTDNLHDNIVGVKGSFAQTIKGLYNLAKFQHQIEIRFVISNLNYK